MSVLVKLVAAIIGKVFARHLPVSDGFVENLGVRLPDYARDSLGLRESISASIKGLRLGFWQQRQQLVGEMEIQKRSAFGRLTALPGCPGEDPSGLSFATARDAVAKDETVHVSGDIYNDRLHVAVQSKDGAIIAYSRIEQQSAVLAGVSLEVKK